MFLFLDICNPQTNSPNEYTVDNSNSLYKCDSHDSSAGEELWGGVCGMFPYPIWPGNLWISEGFHHTNTPFEWDRDRQMAFKRLKYVLPLNVAVGTTWNIDSVDCSQWVWYVRHCVWWTSTQVVIHVSKVTKDIVGFGQGDTLKTPIYCDLDVACNPLEQWKKHCYILLVGQWWDPHNDLLKFPNTG